MAEMTSWPRLLNALEMERRWANATRAAANCDCNGPPQRD